MCREESGWYAIMQGVIGYKIRRFVQILRVTMRESSTSV